MLKTVLKLKPQRFPSAQMPDCANLSSSHRGVVVDGFAAGTYGERCSLARRAIRRSRFATDCQGGPRRASALVLCAAAVVVVGADGGRQSSPTRPVGAAVERRLGLHRLRTVGWEISQLRARRLDELLDPRPLVSGEIVHDHGLAGRERGDEACLHPILEQGGVDRSVESPCRRQAAKAKAGDQSHRFVVAVRDGRPQPAPAPATSAFAREICGSSRLVNENEFRRIEIELPCEPLPASILHVSALLFLGMRRFF